MNYEIFLNSLSSTASPQYNWLGFCAFVLNTWRLMILVSIALGFWDMYWSHCNIFSQWLVPYPEWSMGPFLSHSETVLRKVAGGVRPVPSQTAVSFLEFKLSFFFLSFFNIHENLITMKTSIFQHNFIFRCCVFILGIYFRAWAVSAVSKIVLLRQ